MNTITSENKIKPGYKKTRVGIIPEDWDFDKITSISELIHGFQFRKSHYEENGKYGVIKIGNLSYSGNIIIDNMDYTNATDVNNYERLFLKKGDILMALTGGTLGKVSVFNLENEKYLQNYRVGKFKPINDTNQKFLGYVLQSYIVQKRIEDHVNEAAQPNFGKADFDKIKLPIPPLPEQKAIADCLTTWDNGIEKLTALIQSKKEQKKGLMQQLLTGEKRLDGFTEEWNEKDLSSIGFIPEKEPITEIGDKRTLTVRLYIKGVDFSDNAKTKLTSTGRNYYIRKKGEILIGRQNIHNGGIGLVKTEHDGHICSNALTSFCVNENNNRLFIWHLLSFPQIHQPIEKFMTGTGQKELSEKEFLNLLIKTPSLEEQTAIAEVLTTADKEIELLEKKLDQFKTQKKGLMQVLLTGEKRLV